MKLIKVKCKDWRSTKKNKEELLRFANAPDDITVEWAEKNKYLKEVYGKDFNWWLYYGGAPRSAALNLDTGKFASKSQLIHYVESAL